MITAWFALIFIYYILASLVLAIAGPFLLLKKKSRAGLAQKLGVIPEPVRTQVEQERKSRSGSGSGCGIWLHAVSVGEFNAILPLVKRLNKQMPDIPLYISTTTATGQALAKERAGDFATVFYFPLDLPFASSSWLETLKPQMVAIAETEIWPGFAHECKKRGIKLVSVNGRISPNSFKTYYRMRSFFSRVFSCYTAFGVQTESEAQRFKNVGGERTSVAVLGNLKLDGLIPAPAPDIVAIREKIGLTDDDFVLVAGSTHEGEESAILHVFRILCEEFERGNDKTVKIPRLIIAPRHPERFDRVADIIEEAGFTVKRNSDNQRFDASETVDANTRPAPRQVYLLDSLGQLARFYGLASVAFVGGTLKNVGGHNVAEPYAYSVPVCCGPHIQKTYDVASALQSRQAISITADTEELVNAFLDLYRNPDTAELLGKRGKAWIEENQGACGRTIDFIQGVLDSSKSTFTTSDESNTSSGSSTTSGAAHPTREYTNSGGKR